MDNRENDQGRTTAEQERIDADARANRTGPITTDEAQGTVDGGEVKPAPQPLGIGTRPVASAEQSAIRPASHVEPAQDAQTDVVADTATTRTVRSSSRQG